MRKLLLLPTNLHMGRSEGINDNGLKAHISQTANFLSWEGFSQHNMLRRISGEFPLDIQDHLPYL